MLNPEHSGFNPAERYDKEKYQELSRLLSKQNGLPPIDPFDIYIVSELFDKNACALMKKLLEETHSVIVMESAWIYGRSEEEMGELLRLCGLGEFFAGCAFGRNKVEGINTYLKDHPQIKRYIIVDDADLWGFSREYKLRLVQTGDAFTETDYRTAVAALNGDYASRSNENRLCLSYKDEDIAEADLWSIVISGASTLLADVRIADDADRDVALRVMLTALRLQMFKRSHTRLAAAFPAEDLPDGAPNKELSLYPDLEISDGKFARSQNKAVLSDAALYKAFGVRPLEPKTNI